MMYYTVSMDRSSGALVPWFRPDLIPASQANDPFAPCRHNDGAKTPDYHTMTLLLFGGAFLRSVMVDDVLRLSRAQAMRHLGDLEARRP